MRGIDEGEEIAHRDGLRAVPLEGGDLAPHLLLVERHEHAAASFQALADAPAAPPRCHEGRRLRIHVEVVHARALLPPQLEHVLEALCGEHGGDGALLLEHGIGGDGGAVDEALDGRGGRARLREHAAHGDGHALEEILGRGRDLGQDEAALPVEGHDVGEGAADVDADLHGSVTGPWSNRRSVPRRARISASASMRRRAHRRVRPPRARWPVAPS